MISEGRVREALDQRAAMAPEMNRVLAGLGAKRRAHRNRRFAGTAGLLVAVLVVCGLGWLKSRPDSPPPVLSKTGVVGYAPTWLPPGYRESGRSTTWTWKGMGRPRWATGPVMTEQSGQGLTRQWKDGGVTDNDSVLALTLTVQEHDDYPMSLVEDYYELSDVKVNGRPAKQISGLGTCFLQWRSEYNDILMVSFDGPKETRCETAQRVARSVRSGPPIPAIDQIDVRFPHQKRALSAREERLRQGCRVNVEVGATLDDALIMPELSIYLDSDPLFDGGKPVKVAGRQAFFHETLDGRPFGLNESPKAALVIPLDGGRRLTLLISTDWLLFEKQPKAFADPQELLARLTQFAKGVTVRRFPQCDWA
jgi:hypothetical protein